MPCRRPSASCLVSNYADSFSGIACDEAYACFQSAVNGVRRPNASLAFRSNTWSFVRNTGNIQGPGWGQRPVGVNAPKVAREGRS